MREKQPHHHGDLRAAVLGAAAEIERSGYEGLSLRELAASLGIRSPRPIATSPTGAPCSPSLPRRASMT